MAFKKLQKGKYSPAVITVCHANSSLSFDRFIPSCFSMFKQTLQQQKVFQLPLLK